MITKDFLERIISATADAGDVLMGFHKKELMVRSKHDASVVSEADHASHDVIVERLERIDPSIPILSEEDVVSYDIRKGWKMYWCIDPLDATLEFIRGGDDFTVNIALIKDGVPILGVVHAPALGVTYYAADGHGSFRRENGSDARISVRKYGGGHAVVAIGKHTKRKDLFRFLDLLRKKEGSIEILRVGASLKSCLVAEGKADLYPQFGQPSEWDIAADQCILRNAGGHLIDFNGNDLHYNKEDLKVPPFIAIGPKHFDWVVKYFSLL